MPECHLQEVSFFEAIVKPPLMKLDLRGLLSYAGEPKSLPNGKKTWLLSVVLANFSGTELKLRKSDLTKCTMPASAIDFEWACTSSLKYFKMSNAFLDEKVLKVIT